MNDIKIKNVNYGLNTLPNNEHYIKRPRHLWNTYPLKIKYFTQCLVILQNADVKHMTRNTYIIHIYHVINKNARQT